MSLHLSYCAIQFNVGEIGMETREDIVKVFLVAMAVSVVALIIIYGACSYFSVPATVQEEKMEK